MLVNATGVVPVARVEIISTSCKSITQTVFFLCLCADIQRCHKQACCHCILFHLQFELLKITTEKGNFSSFPYVGTTRIRSMGMISARNIRAPLN